MEQQEPTENKATMFGPKISNNNRKLRLIIAIVVLVVTVVAVVSAVIYVTNNFGSSDVQQSVEAIDTEVAMVEITSEGLTPAAISVKAGQQVKFVNQDSDQHRIMADPESLEAFDSESLLSTGDSYTYVFDLPGTYYYYDSVTPESFTGSVEVRE